MFNAEAAEKSNLGRGVRLIISVLKKYKGLFVRVYLLACCMQLLSLAMPVAIQAIFDKVIMHQGYSTLNALAIAVAVAIIAEGCLAFGSVSVFSNMACRLKATIDLEQVGALLGVPLRYFEKEGVGGVVNRFQEVDGFIEYVTSYNFVQALSSLGFVLIYLAVMAVYSVELTLFVVVVLPLFYLYLRSKTHAVYLLFNKKYAAKSRVTSSLIETVRGIETVKAARMEYFRYDSWRQLEAEGLKAFYEASVHQGRLFHSFDIAGKMFLMVPLFWGAGLVMAGQLTPGGLVAFYMLSSKVFDPVFQVGNMWAQLQRHAVTLSELEKLVTADKEMCFEEQAESLMEPISSLRFEGVSFSYDDSSLRVPALRDVSLQMERGRFYGIIGPTGSGKSTLIKLLHRHYEVGSGTLLINNKSIEQYSIAGLRSSIGFVPQEPLLFSGTIFENISLDRQISRESVLELSQRLGSDEFISAMPDGYDTLLTEGGKGLSGGQRQQICILRALVSEPDVLVLDEPTSAMDYVTESKVVSGIIASAQGKTIIMIAHRLGTLRSADSIFVFNEGRLIESACPEMLGQNAGSVAEHESDFEPPRSTPVGGSIA